MSKRIEDVLGQRTDISRFLVHLTKDCNGKTAKRSLVSILQERKIASFDHYCLFSPKLRQYDVSIQKRFNVVCFTETPLDKIHLLLDISGRKTELRPYGIVFLKDLIAEKNGNPVFYVYEGNRLLKRFLDSEFDQYIEGMLDDDEDNYFAVFGALVNVVKEGHDFHWEREWRIRKHLKFDYDEVFAIVAPEKEHKELRKILGDEARYTPFIDCEWNMEEIVEQTARHMWRLME